MCVSRELLTVSLCVCVEIWFFFHLPLLSYPHFFSQYTSVALLQSTYTYWINFNAYFEIICCIYGYYMWSRQLSRTLLPFGINILVAHSRAFEESSKMLRWFDINDSENCKTCECMNEWERMLRNVMKIYTCDHEHFRPSVRAELCRKNSLGKFQMHKHKVKFNLTKINSFLPKKPRINFTW